jgi:2,3-bisphosphoglycerate-dependent phosphoglycerate mutase
MKNVTMQAKFFKLIVCLLLSNFNALAQKTTIWIVGMPKKHQQPAKDDDPLLSSEGKARAEALAKELKARKYKGYICYQV